MRRSASEEGTAWFGTMVRAALDDTVGPLRPGGGWDLRLTLGKSDAFVGSRKGNVLLGIYLTFCHTSCDPCY